MEQFSIEKAKQGGTIQTRCGFKVTNIDYNSGIEETPIAAVVVEVIKEKVGRGRKKHIETHTENCLTLYHADGRLYDDREDDWDLVIVEENP